MHCQMNDSRSRHPNTHHEDFNDENEFDKPWDIDTFKKKIRATINVVEFCNNAQSFKFVVLFVISTFLLLDLYLCRLIISLPIETNLPISTNSSTDPCYASPFCYINVKGLLMDPPDFYVHIPVASFVINKMDFVNFYQFISPNAISVAHVPVALVASILISHDSLLHRRVGVILFQVRNFLDGVDGIVARARKRAKMPPTPDLKLGVFLNNTGSIYNNQSIKVNPLSGMEFGYWVDGICDSVGSIFLYLGCFYYLKKHPIRRRSLFSYNLLPVVITSRGGSSPVSTNQCAKPKSKTCNIKENTTGIPSGPYIARQIIRSVHRSGLMSILFGFQALFGSMAWNRYIPKYTKILEVHPAPANRKQNESFKTANVLQSPGMWMVIFLWRYVNPHAWVEILLLAILFDKMGELLYLFRLWGFVVIFVAASLTEAHLQYVQSYF